MAEPNRITDDTSDAGLMRWFVQSTVTRMQVDRDPAAGDVKQTAMLAFHFAGKVLDGRRTIVTGLRGPVIGGINIHALAERMRREDGVTS